MTSDVVDQHTADGLDYLANAVMERGEGVHARVVGLAFHHSPCFLEFQLLGLEGFFSTAYHMVVSSVGVALGCPGIGVAGAHITSAREGWCRSFSFPAGTM